MPTLLHVAASPRRDRSRSRVVAAGALSGWQGDIVTHDLAADPIPPITEAWIAASAGDTPTSRTARLIADLKRADVIVISTPFHNWGAPAALKAWIDQISYEGETFVYDPTGPASPYRPLLQDRPVLIAVESGDGSGIAEGGALRGINHLDPYLVTVFGILGLHDLEFLHVSDGNPDEIDNAAMVAADWAAAAYETLAKLDGGLRHAV